MAGKPRQSPALPLVLGTLPLPAILTSGPWTRGGAEIAYANDAFCELTGYTRAALRRRNTRLLHGPETDINRLHQELGDASAARGASEAWLHRKDGSAFFSRWHYGLIGRRGGPMVVIYEDLTGARRQRESLVEAQKLGMTGLLASGLAHDFHNCLSLINGYCEIIASRAEPGSPLHDQVSEMHRAGIQAAGLARQILELGRRRPNETTVANFNPLIRDMAGIVRRLCGEKIAVELRLASDLGNTRLNPQRFQQVLLNLCLNARDAMPQGGRLTLRTLNRPGPHPGPGEVGLEVSDTGVGMAPSVRTRIFEPFFTTKPQGTGLGLSTTHALVREAGGKISVTSKRGQGTTFTLLLPETAEAVPSAGGSGDAATRGSENILLIERDDSLRRMIAGILTADGYRVTDAATATGELVGASPAPRLIIADSARLPALAGKGDAAVPEVGLLSTAMRPPRWNPKAFAHLPKPFALSALMTQVRALLDRAAAP